MVLGGPRPGCASGATAAIAPAGPAPPRADLDADGLPDEWELQYFGSLTQGPGGDLDVDGLTNLGEYQRGTNPTLGDTDGDGCFDGDEVDEGLNPLDNSDCDAAHWPTFVLDVGSAADNNPGQPIYLDEGPGLSLRAGSTAYTRRISLRCMLCEPDPLPGRQGHRKVVALPSRQYGKPARRASP